MGSATASAMTSLDRLKALDSLPDLRSQLAEIEKLCSRPARAEMIIRWLLGKLNTSEEARASEKSWGELALSLRQIPVQRSAALLGSHGFWDVLAAACKEVSNIETLKRMAALFHELFERSGADDGAALRATLSIEGSKAAELCRDWFLRLLECNQIGWDFDLISQGLLNPAISLWKMRRRHDGDDAAFTQMLLLPCLRMRLRILHVPEYSRHKRKRSSNGMASTHEMVQILDELVQQHSARPLRADFFKRNGPQTGRQGDPSEMLVDMPTKAQLNGLHITASQAADELDWQVWRSFFEISAHAMPLSTLTLRQKEEPWLQTLFVTLCSCMKGSGSSQARSNEELRALLKVLKDCQLSLPSSLLVHYLRHDAGLSPDSQVLNDDLIAAVLDLDANVFTDHEVTDSLMRIASQTFPDEDLLASRLRMTRLVVPVIKAYARKRNLPDFFALWIEHLNSQSDLPSNSPLTDLSETLSEILEDTVSFDQIVTMMDQASLQFVPSADRHASDIAFLHYAAFVHLKTIFVGAKSLTIRSQMYPRMDALMPFLLELGGHWNKDLPPGLFCQLCSALTAAFEVWFPQWAVAQANRDTVVEKGQKLLTSSCTKCVIDFCQSANELVQSSQTQTAAIASGHMFLATLCNVFGQFGDSQCTTTSAEITRMILNSKEIGYGSLIKFPALLHSLDSSDGQVAQLMSTHGSGSVRTDPLEMVNGTENGDGMVKSLKAVVSCSSEALDLLLATLNTAQSQQADGKSKTLPKLSFLSVLECAPFPAMRPNQVRALLEAALKLNSIGDVGAKLDQSRLLFALVLKCLDSLVKQRGSEVEQHSNLYWTLLDVAAGIPSVTDSSIDSETQSDVSQLRESVLDLFDNITRAFIEQWLKSQQTQASQAHLMRLSDWLQTYAKTMKTKKDLRSTQRVTLSAEFTAFRASVEMLEQGLRSELRQKLSYRLPAVFEKYLSALLNAAKFMHTEISSASPDTNQIPSSRHCALMLKYLVTFPAASWPLLEGDGSDYRSRIVELAKEILEAGCLQPNLTPIISSSFQLVCVYARDLNTEIAALLPTLLLPNFSSVERGSLLKNFEQALSSLNPPTRLRILDSLASSHTTFDLQHKVIQSVSELQSRSESASFTTDLIDRLQHHILGSTDPHAILPALTVLQSLLKDKSLSISQPSIEQTLSTLHKTLIRSPPDFTPFASISLILNTIFAHHRARLSGRFHLLTSLLSAFLSSLFTLSRTLPLQTSTTYSRSLARLLELFASPSPNTQRQRHSKSKPTPLVDLARKARALAGQFAPFILHAYCTQLLLSPPPEPARHALNPGLWALIEAVEANSAEGIQVLSAAMNHSERAVLRILVSEWRRSAKWEGL